ncbi:high frequency lysogenization protein HflD [Streptacidiphilus neutrinimicus]|uniref:HoxN/HupN/NixA family nickel/cobalt transporter n=1 Tax=Streptacidiphilus neutrinimicus TaxID=105420 RepID=UPI000A67F3BE|nr:high frequency lysogenization protein HflD [Streptacidiphilus neutrinimicus]
MAQRHLARRAAVLACAVLWLCGVTAPQADAHPLGNFSINHYTGFVVHADHVDVLAVTDTAEIPTLQQTPAVDTDHDGTESPAERAAWARARCTQTAGKLTVTAPAPMTFTVTASSFVYQPGQAGLRTSRLECRLRAPLNLAGGPLAFHVDTGADSTRVGWNEITAQGVGTHLQDSTVPQSSPSDELRHYPRDLLSTPLGDTRAQFTVIPGQGTSTTSGNTPDTGLAGGLTAGLEGLSRQLTGLAATRHLTIGIGLLAVLLSLILGAGHAMLPGHGKTVMAAYLAGKQGRARDAVTVGATVTLTHTAGVLVIGLCLTTFSSLAGDTVLNWLGVASGALVAAVGVKLLTDALRRPRGTTHPSDATSPAATPAMAALVGATEPIPGTTAGTHDRAPQDHDAHVHHDPHHHHAGTDHHHTHGDAARPHEPHRHGPFGHHHSHAPAAPAQPFTTRGLIGLGIAGGLVPSPSALVVLLGAIALGRTAFGATLVVAYGMGMAATLTAVGLLLVRLGDRLGPIRDRPAFAVLRRIAPHTATLTAALVLIVGLGLMIRSLAPAL